MTTLLSLLLLFLGFGIVVRREKPFAPVGTHVMTLDSIEVVQNKFGRSSTEVRLSNDQYQAKFLVSGRWLADNSLDKLIKKLVPDDVALAMGDKFDLATLTGRRYMVDVKLGDDDDNNLPKAVDVWPVEDADDELSVPASPCLTVLGLLAMADSFGGSIDLSLILAGLAGLAGLVGVFFDVDRYSPPKKDDDDEARDSMSLAEQAALLAPWAVRRFLDGKSVTAKLAKQEIPAFQESYIGANGIGDVLGSGHGQHPDTFGLYPVPRRSPKVYRSSYENTAIVWNRCTDEERAEIAEERDQTIVGLENIICGMDRETKDEVVN